MFLEAAGIADPEAVLDDPRWVECVMAPPTTSASSDIWQSWKAHDHGHLVGVDLGGLSLVGGGVELHQARVCQAQPLTSTQMFAANSLPSGMSCVPPPCARTFDGGINSSAVSHNPSGTIQHRPAVGAAQGRGVRSRTPAHPPMAGCSGHRKKCDRRCRVSWRQWGRRSVPWWRGPGRRTDKDPHA
ncbi:hypothetical protein SHO565_53250 [Streptomyces sp. HO565]